MRFVFLTQSVLCALYALHSSVLLAEECHEQCTFNMCVQEESVETPDAEDVKGKRPIRAPKPINGTDFVDDLAIKLASEAKANKMIKAKRAIRCRDLAKRLVATKCSISLPEKVETPIDSPDLYERGCKSIVLIYVSRPHKDHWHLTPAATGFIINDSGAFVTNHHVVDRMSDQYMFALTSDQRLHPVTDVLASNEANDVAICKIEASGLQPISLRTGIRVGERVRVISHPSGRIFSMTEGMVSRRYARIEPRSKPKDSSSSEEKDSEEKETEKEEDEQKDVAEKPKRPRTQKLARTRWVTITADFASGSSGAPIFDAMGNAIGVASRTSNVKVGDKDKVSQMVFHDCVPAEVILGLIENQP